MSIADQGVPVPSREANIFWKDASQTSAHACSGTDRRRPSQFSFGANVLTSMANIFVEHMRLVISEQLIRWHLPTVYSYEVTTEGRYGNQLVGTRYIPEVGWKQVRIAEH